MVQKHNLTFPLLLDPGNDVAREFGLVFTLPDYLREIYLGFGIDLERFNGDASWTLPMPGRFIIDRDGIVRDAETHPDYTQRPEPTSILTALSTLRRG